MKLAIQQIGSTELPASLLGTLGNSIQVYNFTLNNSGSSIASFQPQDQVEVTLDYELKPNENPNQVIVYYISDHGTLEVVKNGRYDALAGKVKFKPAHFSKYAAAYSPVGLSDLAISGWASDAIKALAAREVISGYEDGTFKPAGAVTRAEFITMLMNAFDLVDSSEVSQYSDVKENAWYASSIASAEKLGIVTGKTDGTFGTADPITRQEMAVMAYRIFKQLGLNWNGGTAFTETFVDQPQIADYAKDAVTALQQTGIISGLGAGSFGPHLSTTRVEAAVLIYNLSGKSI